MYSFSYLEPVCCSMSSCFLTCIQISQEAGQVVWYSYLFQNFPQFIVIHTVKGFGIVNKADVFLELSCFFDDPRDVGNLISGSSAFSKTSLNIWKFTVHYCWSLAWRILSITLLVCIGEGNGNPLQCSCLENPRDSRAWWVAVYGVTQSRTRLKRLSSSSSWTNMWGWVATSALDCIPP